MSRARAVAVGIVLATTQVGASCGQRALGVLPGVINDAGNLTLRREILAYGTTRMCAEMRKRGAPLRFRQEDPAIGRFFATDCAVTGSRKGEISVRFSGFGYAWTNLTGRLTFEASGATTYDTDFQMSGSSMYVYFRSKPAPQTAFKARVIERTATSLVLTGLGGGGGRGIADLVGASVVRQQIGRGFTVAREPNGSAQFALGVVPPGELPSLTPFQVGDTSKVVVANDRSEVHREQRDFVGPIEVGERGRVFVHVTLDGAPAADVLLVPKAVGEAWLQQYELQPAPTPPPGAPILDDVVQGSTAWKRTLTVAPGAYYLVLDNSSTAGRTPSGAVPGDDRAALFSYGIAVDP